VVFVFRCGMKFAYRLRLLVLFSFCPFVSVSVLSFRSCFVFVFWFCVCVCVCVLVLCLCLCLCSGFRFCPILPFLFSFCPSVRVCVFVLVLSSVCGFGLCFGLGVCGFRLPFANFVPVLSSSFCRPPSSVCVWTEGRSTLPLYVCVRRKPTEGHSRQKPKDASQIYLFRTHLGPPVALYVGFRDTEDRRGI
jgi:hypothetical protein